MGTLGNLYIKKENLATGIAGFSVFDSLYNYKITTKMIENYHIPKVVPINLQEQILNTSNSKYQCIILLMLDCGARITEAIRLQVKHVNFFDNYILVESLKKRGNKIEYRKIPMTSRLVDAFGAYWKVLKNKEPDSYLFPPGTKKSKANHLSRIQVYRYIKKRSNKLVYPHKLRHTFASNIVSNGNDIRTAQALLGHKSQATTEIYLHVEYDKMKEAIKSIEHIPWHQRIIRMIVPKKKVFLTPTRTGMTSYHVGRKDELLLLSDLRGKKINTYIKGPQGIGKSHLLDNLVGEKILRIDEFKGKNTLVGLLMELFDGDKEEIKELLYGDKEDYGKIVMRETIKRLVELAIQVTEKGEYTIIIDDVTDITKSGVRMLEKLKNHFHIICAARQLKIDKGTFLTNFEVIELQPLNREESLELVGMASKTFMNRIGDYETYKNHIWEKTSGIPLFILEIVDRYSKESDISLEVIKDIKHATAMKEIDMSLFVVICVSALMVLRYVGGEVGSDTGAFKLIGGMALLFALFGRPLMRMGQRKFV